MTRDEVLSMPAGIKMNFLVAEKVMGWTYNHLGDAWERDGERWIGADKFQPSRDIKAAWMVVEKMEMFYFEYDKTKNEYFAMANDSFDTTVTCASAPLAICRAVLLAVTK